MNLFFLQVIVDSAKIKDSLEHVAQLAAQQKENLWDILSKGGVLMIPLALLLVIEILIGKYMHDGFIRPVGGDYLVVILLYVALGLTALVMVLTAVPIMVGV